MSGVGAYLWIAYLAVAIVFAVEITLIAVRRRNIERFIGDLDEESQASDTRKPGLSPDSGSLRGATRDEVDPVDRSSQGTAG